MYITKSACTGPRSKCPTYHLMFYHLKLRENNSSVPCLGWSDLTATLSPSPWTWSTGRPKEYSAHFMISTDHFSELQNWYDGNGPFLGVSSWASLWMGLMQGPALPPKSTQKAHWELSFSQRKTRSQCVHHEPLWQIKKYDKSLSSLGRVILLTGVPEQRKKVSKSFGFLKILLKRRLSWTSPQTNRTP